MSHHHLHNEKDETIHNAALSLNTRPTISNLLISKLKEILWKVKLNGFQQKTVTRKILSCFERRWECT